MRSFEDVCSILSFYVAGAVGLEALVDFDLPSLFDFVLFVQALDQTLCQSGSVRSWKGQGGGF